jgi:hypothetical protein
MTPPRVFLALPHRGDAVPEALLAAGAGSRRAAVALVPLYGTLLTTVFNVLFCRCLDERDAALAAGGPAWTHFAMLHADVAPAPGWLDVLLGEMEAHGVDLVSAVLPIKNGKGLTSTGAADPDTGDVRRLTLREAFNLPETFTAADLPPLADLPVNVGWAPGATLAVNTGCWACRLDRPWVDEVVFQQRDWIERTPGGRRVARCEPEDWGFSRQLARLGVPVAATRKVKATHWGRAGYTNGVAWGTHETDAENQQP